MNALRAASVSTKLLLSHRVRTLASCAAVFVGVAALVLMVGVGQAAERDLISGIRMMGSNILAIRPGRFVRFGRRLEQVSRPSTLTPRDEQLLRTNLPRGRAFSGVASGTVEVSYRGKRTTLQLKGVEPNFFMLSRERLRSGRVILPEEDRTSARIAVLSAAATRELFDQANPLGTSVRIGGIPFSVVGVLADKEREPTADGAGSVAYVPLRTALLRIFAQRYLDMILVQTERSEDFPVMRRQITEVLRHSHMLPDGQQNDFAIHDPVALLKAEHDMGESFCAVVGGVAIAALATGGIAIISVMLMAVRERTREIGLRRAIGATRRAILVQFLLESALLTSVGGLAGAATALPTNALICRLAGWPVVWPLAAAFGAMAFSICLGLLCGVVPAVRASRMEPAEAVRSTA